MCGSFSENIDGASGAYFFFLPDARGSGFSANLNKYFRG